MDSVNLRSPKPRKDWALFLDLDGTLIDIADEPDTVIVPEALPAGLRSASDWLGGALALVSGRSLDQIDRLLAPLRLPCACEHGAVMRLPDGGIWRADASYAVPDEWRQYLRAAVSHWSGVIVEDKTYSVALHFRKAPSRADQILRLAEMTMKGRRGVFRVLPARMAYEIQPLALNKGEAIRRFLECAPFRERVPVFVGDDATDEDGFRVAAESGGFALRVQDAFDGSPSKVRRWLAAFHA